MCKAIIDLGTNTCNLLIVDFKKPKFNILFQGKEHVRLGDGSIAKNQISNAAFLRTAQALKAHIKTIENFGATNTRILATSAIRDATNKNEFLEFLNQQFNIEIEVICGEREAELIYKGVLLAFSEIKKPSLILDIGGGSNEFIIANSKGILWKTSTPTGISRLINKIILSDPVSSQDIIKIENFFQFQHSHAINKCDENNVQTLIGCSGAFDTIADIIDQVNPGEKMRTQQNISINDFLAVYKKLISSTRESRLLIRGMDTMRIDLIVPAVILINQVINNLKINTIYQTDFALREGILFEMLKSH